MAPLLDRLLYAFARFQNKKSNRAYLETHPGIVLPPDYDLYETFRLNYRKFMEDGALAAKEIIEWTSPYISSPEPRILDWGCGVGRITKHIRLLNPGAIIYGCDINERMIAWDKENYPGISFTVISNFVPTLYAPGFFNLVYGISILTHIEAEQQLNWITELHRILENKGVLLVTTQGSHYQSRLLPFQKAQLRRKGIFTQGYPGKGHRMMSTYHTEAHFRRLLEPYFTVREYFDGKQHPSKMGGQDVWILIKK